MVLGHRNSTQSLPNSELSTGKLRRTQMKLTSELSRLPQPAGTMYEMLGVR